MFWNLKELIETALGYQMNPHLMLVLGQGTQQPVNTGERDLPCSLPVYPALGLGLRMYGTPALTLSVSLTLSAKYGRWLRCSLKLLLAPIFSYFSYSPPGKLRGDYFQDKDFSQVLFNKEPSWNSKVCYLLNDKVGFTGGYAIQRSIVNRFYLPIGL